MTKMSERLRKGILRWPDGGLKYNDASNVMEQSADLLDECERALEAVISRPLSSTGEKIARATLAKLRSQEKADE